MFSAKDPQNYPKKTCIKVIMTIFSDRKFSFSSFLFILTLVEWSYFVDDPLVIALGIRKEELPKFFVNKGCHFFTI